MAHKTTSATFRGDSANKDWWQTVHTRTLSVSHVDGVGAYIRDITKYRLISIAEEIGLYQRLEIVSTQLLLALLSFASVRSLFNLWHSEISAGRLQMVRVFGYYPEQQKDWHTPRQTPKLMEAIIRHYRFLGGVRAELTEERLRQLSSKRRLTEKRSSVLSVLKFAVQLRFTRVRIDEMLAVIDADYRSGQLSEELQLQRERAHRLSTELESVYETMVKANLRLVFAIAKRYVGTTDLDLLDLVSSGNEGLIRAAERFDYRRGARFSTLASPWIRQAILRAMHDGGSTIRKPQHVNVRLGQARRLMEQLNVKQLSVAQIVEHLGFSESSARELHQALYLKTESYDSLLYLDGENEGGYELLADEKADDPQAEALQSLLRREIKEVLQTLSRRDAEVITLLFGLGDESPMTLDEVGQRYGLTRERIRQIKEKAIKRLQLPHRARKLKRFYSE